MKRLYSLEEIKAAYWEEFHEAGEIFFPPFKSHGQTPEEATERAWQDFVEALDKAWEVT